MAGTAKGIVENVEEVQLDGLVALKIIKHCQEEGSSTELVNGFLVGLVVGKTLEITNCFPLPKDLDDTQDRADDYQVNILKKLRAINLDYHQVGWYQSTYLGSHASKEFLDNQVKYQQAIEESVVVIYDPLQSTQGSLSLKAFRLTKDILSMMQQGDPFTPESVLGAGMTHSKLLIEIPVTLKTSRLENALLCELDAQDMGSEKMEFLGLSTTQLLEKNLQLLMDSVDNLQQETYRLLGYEKNVSKQLQQKQQFIQRRKEENARRAQRGEPQLSIADDVIDQELNLKPVQAPPRLDALLIGEHVDSKCRQITEVAAETFAKLYLSEGLQQK